MFSTKTITLIFLIGFMSFHLHAQVKKGLVAKYSFNEGNAKDEVGVNDAKVVGASFVRDRFGNSKSAFYLHGNYGSYLNLGVSEVLKPKEGTFSIWFYIDNPMFKGQGLEVNPIVLAKCKPGDDFYEGYFIAYDFNLKKICATTALSELMQVTLHTADTIALREWHHVAITYDKDYVCLFFNGVLDSKMAKNFESYFLAEDSVMIGNTANTKNKRFFNGSIDDIEIYNRVLSESEIEDIYNASDPKAYKVVIKWALRALAVILLILVIVFLVNIYFKKKIQKEREKNELQSHMSEMEMRVIKAQMNPHFIFNSLNSIQQFILANENDKAQIYLSKFARLIRKLLESNMKENILLSDEVELLKKYLEIESLRFNNAFNYDIYIDDKINSKNLFIPHFLIQPFVENAIWHGLLPKKGEKNLNVKFSLISENILSCIIEDNGVGRKKSIHEPEIAEKKSLAINFIRQRLEFLGKVHHNSFGVHITDKVNTDGKNYGTKVEITLPVINT